MEAIFNVARSYFERFGGPLVENDWLLIRSKLKLQDFKEGEFFQRSMEPPVYVGLVVKGLFRVFYTNPDGKEFTRAFADEGTPIGDFANFLTGNDSNVTIVALEDCKVIELQFSDYEHFFEVVQNWNKIGRKIVEKFYITREKREAELALLSAKERFEKFKIEHSAIAGRISNAYVANFLGITPETLSRLKISK